MFLLGVLVNCAAGVRAGDRAGWLLIAGIGRNSGDGFGDAVGDEGTDLERGGGSRRGSIQ